MPGAIPPYVLYIASIIVSAAISMYSVKKILFITRHRKMYDIPDNIRKIHGANIPSLGGIGIFIGYVFVAAFFIYTNWFYVVAASVILFFTGIYDDIMNMRPSKKLMAQLIASAIAIYFADIRILSLHGLFGVHDLPYWAGIALTTFCCTFFINVFNFVDGIDGLACFMAILYTGLLGIMFAAMGESSIAGISFGLAGATIGLLYYNMPPARIYMGDTGSMVLGFSIFLLSVLFIAVFGRLAIGSHDVSPTITKAVHSDSGAMVVVLSILFLPIYDAIRVFILRLSRAVSPLRADRTHLHYYLLDAGFTHAQAVTAIVTANVLIAFVGFLLQDVNPNIAISGIAVFTTLLLAVVYKLRLSRMAK